MIWISTGTEKINKINRKKNAFFQIWFFVKKLSFVFFKISQIFNIFILIIAHYFWLFLIF